jgi:WD40 repeat protein
VFVVCWPSSARSATESSSDNIDTKQIVIKTPQPIAATAGNPTYLLPDHRSVVSLGFTPDGKTLVSVSHEKAPDSDAARFVIRTWDVAEKKLASEVELEWDQAWNRGAGNMILSRDRTKLISSIGEQAAIWDVATGKIVKRLMPPDELRDGRIHRLDCTPDMSYVAGGRVQKHSGGLLPDAHAVVWDANTGRVVQAIMLKHAIHVQSLAISPDGKLLAAGGLQSGTNVYEVSTGKLRLAYRNTNPDRKHPSPELQEGVSEFVSDVAFAPHGNLLAVTDMLSVKLIDPLTGDLVQQIDAPYRYYSGPRSLVFSADGQLISRFGTCMKLREAPTDRVTPIWSTKTGRLVSDLPIEANDIAFSNDDKWAAVGFSDLKAAVAVWQLEPESK